MRRDYLFFSVCFSYLFLVMIVKKNVFFQVSRGSWICNEKWKIEYLLPIEKVQY